MAPVAAAARFGLTLRPAADTDDAFIAALYASTRADEMAQTGWPPAQRAAFLLHQHRAQHAYYQAHYARADWLVIERDGERIGRLYLAEWSDDVRIIDISLVRAARGHGIGAALLTDVCAWAAAKGKPVSIHVEKNNPARRLYGRLGFVVVADKGVYDLMTWRPAAAGD